MSGGSGNDHISGQNGHDRLYGGKGEDKLFGGAGNDFLWGNQGDDVLTGGAGADSFFFANGGGSDWIEDFEAGLDTIYFYASGSSFHSVEFSEETGGTLLSYGDVSVFLSQIELSQIEKDDFVFNH